MAATLSTIVELINDVQPDIIGVQELYSDQLNDLKSYLEPTYEFYCKPCKDGELNGIFYRRERFEPIDCKVLYMTETPDIPSGGTLTMIQLKDHKTGRIFAVFNTHLAFSNIEKREFQARFIADHVEIYAKQMPVIVMGDLNTFPNRPDLKRFPFYDGDYIHRLLTQYSLRDARERAIIGHLGPISTFTNELDEAVPFKGTGTPGVFLDHIYVSSAIFVLVHAVQPGKVDGHFPSDHLPVIVDYLVESSS
jgi:endonuclease/exonuclease/phosphatase family metal-dependent hydrolase